jgi:non-ribosomal peptide synthetase-like protein
MNASLDEQTRCARLRRKNVYNLVTALLFLASRWMAVFITLVIAQTALASYNHFGIFALFAGIWALTVTYIAFFIVLERASLGFKRLQPQLVSIYDPYFWWHERHWKLSTPPIPNIFAGTPFRGLLLRSVGMKVGTKLFDCSQAITEPSLTEVGDYANLNEGCVLQAHSLEEGVFKSDYIRLGNRCSVGPGAFVHYGVKTGDHVVLDADSFLMKGETPESNTGWCGNPAKLARRHVAQVAVRVQDAADATVRNDFVPQRRDTAAQ